MNTITLASGQSFVINPGMSMVSAALSAGIHLPHSCNNGRCNSCKCRVINGETIAMQEELGLSEKEKIDGWILTCVRTAKTDVILDVEDLSQFFLPPCRTLPCRINNIEFFSNGVLRLELRIPPDSDFKALPGQYVDLIGPGGVRRSYSLANCQTSDSYLEFHIREVHGGAMSDYLFKRAKFNDLLRINGPLGTFFLRNLKYLNLVFLATGTGIAPVKAMLEKLAVSPASEQAQSVTVYWGGRESKDLYCDPAEWYPKVNYIPVLSRAADDWLGSRGYVQQALLSDRPDLEKTVVYACGSDDMIKSAKAELTLAGLPVKHFFSDAFVPSGT